MIGGGICFNGGGGGGGGRDADISMAFSPACLFQEIPQSIYYARLLRGKKKHGGCILISDIRICGVG